jgi:hypothetical protein
MWIVAIAWIYVVGLMAITEASAVAGIMTFFGYCVLPLSLLYYLTGSGRRRARREAAQRSGGSGDSGDSFPICACDADSGSSDSDSGGDSGGGDGGD